LAEGIAIPPHSFTQVVYTRHIASDEDKFVHPEEEDDDAVDVCHHLQDKLHSTGEVGQQWDMLRPLEGDCSLVFFTFDQAEGREAFWHSSAHVLGQALESTFGTKLTIGPPTSEGFYYDAYMGAETYHQEDFAKVEAAAAKIVKEDQPFERVVLTKQQALALFGDNPFKVQLIANKIPDDKLTTAYRCGSLIDLCTGPHIPGTGKIKAFQVLRSSSTNWLGNTVNDSLQRLYAVSFPEAKLLKKHMANLEAAKKNDHRHIGTEQELFFFHELSPGSAFWTPAGTRIYTTLMNMIREEYRARGFREVITPNVFNLDLWHTSGHAQHYLENMFTFKVEGQDFGMKPMNCPGHCLMFGHKHRSYRELPIRIADFGVLHRNEFSGALTGLTRVRRFCQDDAHIFAAMSQIEHEIAGALDFVKTVYGTFGMGFELNLSTRPKKALGAIVLWNQAELALRHALDAFGEPWTLNPGDGAFYGPKIDIRVTDAMGRAHQCATIQLDFQLPIRFDLKYKAQESASGALVSGAGAAEVSEEALAAQDALTAGLPAGYARPVMIHRAVLGSLERCSAVLAEHFAGKWPLWLSPRQIKIVPITMGDDVLLQYCFDVQEELFKEGFEVEVDESSETQKKKLRNAQVAGWNYIFTVGASEVEERGVNIRERDTAAGAKGRVQMTPLVDAIAMLKQVRGERK
jgi:threonyl-tRNA synthetase